MRTLFSFLMAAVLVWSLMGCGNFQDGSASRIETSPPLNTDGTSKIPQRGSLSEVAPPLAIQQLSQSLEAYQPQVSIVSPSADEVLQDTKVSVQFQVQDLPVFKDPDLGLGPHLHVILDNQPYKAVYDLDQPLVFEDLPPGTHTLRVFASRPWHESFKNEGAYAQTTFHVFTKTTDNNPEPALPLLTYSRPTGSYGAEPIMLDFYLTNAPLHIVAQESPDDEIADWRIRVTVNGESFVLDRWQPIYLTGFKPGKNWVQLEFLDEQGNPVKNVFNDTVRLISYEPKGKDTLSKLMRGELSAEAAHGIVGSNYKFKPTPVPEVTPTPSPSPTETPTPIPSVTPSVEETPTSEPTTPEEKPTPEAESTPTEAKETENPKSGGFFSRFRRPAAAPSPSAEPTVPEESEQTPEPEASLTPIEPPAVVEESTPEPEAVPTPVIKPVPVPIEPETPKSGGFFSRFRRPAAVPSPSAEPTVPEEPEQTPEPEASVTPIEPPAVVEESTPEPEAVPTPVIKPVPVPIEPETPKSGGFFSRFRRPAAVPSPSLKLPEDLEVPSPEPTVVPEVLEPKAETTPEPEASVIPSKPPASIEEPTNTAEPRAPEVEPTAVIKPVPIPIQPEKPKADGFLKRLRVPVSSEATPDSGLPPTLPEITETPLPQPLEPEAAFPEPQPSTDSELKSSSSTPPETSPLSESRAEKELAASSSQTLEIPNPEPATAKPKLDLKEVFVSPPASTPSLRLIQAPAEPESDIPTRFLKKLVPDSPTNVPESLEAPTAD